MHRFQQYDDKTDHITRISACLVLLKNNTQSAKMECAQMRFNVQENGGNIREGTLV